MVSCQTDTSQAVLSMANKSSMYEPDLVLQSLVQLLQGCMGAQAAIFTANLPIRRFLDWQETLLSYKILTSRLLPELELRKSSGNRDPRPPPSHLPTRSKPVVFLHCPASTSRKVVCMLSASAPRPVQESRTLLLFQSGGSCIAVARNGCSDGL